MYIITEEENDKAIAVVEYLSKKTSMQPQEVFDRQVNINTILIYRIQQLELKVQSLENMFLPTPP